MTLFVSSFFSTGRGHTTMQGSVRGTTREDWGRDSLRVNGNRLRETGYTTETDDVPGKIMYP